MKKRMSQNLLAGLLILVLAPLSVLGMATCVVTSNQDDGGANQLRTCLAAIGEGGRITFNLPTGQETITLLQGALPVDTNNVTIDGYSQPGASEATDSSLANIVVTVQGPNNDEDGFQVTGNGITIQGLSIVNFNGDNAAAVEITGNMNTLAGSYIGLNTNGTTAAPNTDGVSILGNNNTVGGDTVATRTVVSGNDVNGILISGGSSNVIQNARVGTNAAGTSAVANNIGVHLVEGSTENLIEQSLLSGNTNDGVFFEATEVNVNNNIVRLSNIGTNAAGTAAIANGRDGVRFAADDDQNVNDNLVQCNIIAFNGASGIFNHDGGGMGNGNQFQANNDWRNTNNGITLANDGNNNIQPPMITAATANGSIVKVSGTFANSAAPNTRHILEFFSNDENRNPITEGQTFLGSVAATTDAMGNGSFENVQLVADATVGQWVSATVTNDQTNDTSQYSLNRQLAQGTEQSALSIAIIEKYCSANDDFCDTVGS